MSDSMSTKRFREDNEDGESSVKRIKSKSNEEKKCEYTGNNSKNQKPKSERIRMREESHFLRLFTKVLKAIIAIKDVEVEKMYESIQLIKSTFIRGEDSISFSDVDLTNWENLCGYLHRFGSHGAGLARFRILNAIQNCTRLKKGLKKQDLKVICFGAGPGNDAVGLCSALPKHPENLKITLVDRYKEWRLCMKLAKTLIEENNFGKVSELFKNSNVELSFIQAELPSFGYYVQDKSSNYSDDLKEADVIIICRLFTNINKSSKNIYNDQFTKILQKYMKEDAIILLIDKFFDDNWEGFDQIYFWGDEEDERYIPSYANGDIVGSILPISVIMKQKYDSE